MLHTSGSILEVLSFCFSTEEWSDPDLLSCCSAFYCFTQKLLLKLFWIKVAIELMHGDWVNHHEFHICWGQIQDRCAVGQGTWSDSVQTDCRSAFACHCESFSNTTGRNYFQGCNSILEVENVFAREWLKFEAIQLASGWFFVFLASYELLPVWYHSVSQLRHSLITHFHHPSTKVFFFFSGIYLFLYFIHNIYLSTRNHMTTGRS